jgi:uncharacterized membrane protein
MMKPGVGSILMVYGLTACVFFIIDLFWLGLAAKGLYQRHIGELLRAQVNWTAAILFYAIYIAGIEVFVLIPALQDGAGIVRTAVMGGLLGFFAYSTFDLTCLALIRNWSVTIAALDMLWGTLLTAFTSVVVIWLVRNVVKIGQISL